MTSARTEILQRVRRAVHHAPPAPRPVRTPPMRPDGDVITLLVDRLVDYGTTVVRVPAGFLAAAIRDAVHSADAKSLCVPADIPEAWLEAVAAPAGPAKSVA